MSNDQNENKKDIDSLNNLMFQKRIFDKANPLEVDELRKELNLQFERISIQSEINSESKTNEEKLI